MHALDSPTDQATTDDTISPVITPRTLVLPTPKLELLPPRSLILRPPYGRQPSSRRLAYLRANWLPQAIGTLSVARRANGTIAVIDGTHRGTIAVEIGIPDVLPCLVYEGLTLAQEAQAYLKFNDVLPQSALDLFHAELDAGDANSIAINAAVEDAELRVQSGHRFHTADVVSCVVTLRKVAARYGIDHLADTLMFMSNTFDGQGSAINAKTLPAFAGVLAVGNGIKHFDRGHLHNVVSEFGIAKLTGLAENVHLRTLVPRHVAFGVALADLYNRHRRSGKLPRSPLAPQPRDQD